MFDMNQLFQIVVEQCVEKVENEIYRRMPEIIDNIITYKEENTNYQISASSTYLENTIRKIVKEELNNLKYQSTPYYNNKDVAEEVERLKRSYGSITADGWVFYMNKDEGERLYKIRLDGTENTQLTTGRVRYVDNVENGWVYYTDFNFADQKIKLDE